MLTPDKAAAKQTFGLSADAFTIAFVGNRYDIKGLPVLLSAIKALPAHVNLLVVGNAEEVGFYQTQAEKLGISQRVKFLGAVNGVEKVYQAADCLAHPTLEDTFAMVVLEAMSYGLPVVVSREKYCGVAGLLTDGLNALILDDPKDSVALAELLQRILGSAELRGKLGAEALKFADGFAWDQIAREQEHIYSQITSKLLKPCLQQRLLAHWQAWELGPKRQRHLFEFCLLAYQLRPFDRRTSPQCLCSLGQRLSFLQNGKTCSFCQSLASNQPSQA